MALILIAASGEACGRAGSPGGVDAGTTYPTAATMPAALTPCPTGWEEVAPGSPLDVRTCEPWPGAGPLACDAASAQFPGDAACSEVGSTCPSGDFPEDLPAGTPVLYVSATAAQAGDGSQAL